LAEKLGVPIEGPHIDDKFWIDKLDTVEDKPGFDATKSFTPDRWLEGHDTVTLGDLTLEVRHCPGHTPGHVIFFHEPSQLAIVGDVIFRGSVGRSDLERGDHDTLVASIQEQLWPLGNDVIFLPGHGRLSTFGQEREDNPFVSDAVLGNRFGVSDPDAGPKMGPSFDA
jgi:glyoxylase-like metal-dependent hydrolase (beta-lactamase superfamily II)